MFEDHPALYYLTAKKFFHAACRLEEVANFGDEIWQEEMDKLELPPNTILQHKKTEAMQLSESDRECRDISAYSFTHALELTLKAICLQHKLPVDLHTHKISKLLNAAKTIVDIPATLDPDQELTTLIQKLDEVSLWAGRYPAPKSGGREKAISTLSYTDFGKTDNLVVTLSNGAKHPLKILKELCAYVLQKTESQVFVKNTNNENEIHMVVKIENPVS